MTDGVKNLEVQCEEVEGRALAILAEHDFGIVPLENGSRFRRCLPKAVIDSGDYETELLGDPYLTADLPPDVKPAVRDAAAVLMHIDCLKVALDVKDAELAMRSGVRLGRTAHRMGLEIFPG